MDPMVPGRERFIPQGSDKLTTDVEYLQSDTRLVRDGEFDNRLRVERIGVVLPQKKFIGDYPSFIVRSDSGRSRRFELAQAPMMDKPDCPVRFYGDVSDQAVELEGTESEPAWHPDPGDGRLVFVHQHADTYTIKLLNITDGSITDGYSGNVPIRQPRWTYGADKIAFILHGTGNFGVYLIDPVGGAEPSPIPKPELWYPVVHHYCSHSKPVVWYVEQTGVENLFSIPLDGGLAQVQSANGNSNNTFGGVAESKDGSKLAVSTLTYDLNSSSWGSALYQLKTHPPSPDWKDAIQLAINMPLSEGSILLQWVSPDWSPQGDRIAVGVRLDYWGDGKIEHKYDIAVIRFD